MQFSLSKLFQTFLSEGLKPSPDISSFTLSLIDSVIRSSIAVFALSVKADIIIFLHLLNLVFS